MYLCNVLSQANTLGNTGSTEAYMKRLQMIAAIEDEKVDNLEGTVQERETLKKVRRPL